MHMPISAYTNTQRGDSIYIYTEGDSVYIWPTRLLGGLDEHVGSENVILGEGERVAKRVVHVRLPYGKKFGM